MCTTACFVLMIDTLFTAKGMKPLFTIWMFVASATVSVGVCDDSSLAFESYRETGKSSLSNAVFMAVVSENDPEADPKDQFQDVFDDKLLNETYFSPIIVKQSTNQVRGRRSTSLPSTSALHTLLPVTVRSDLMNLLPFRNAHDFYHTVTDVLFRRPGFIIGFLNLAVILVGPFWVGVRSNTVPVTSPRLAVPLHQSFHSSTYANVVGLLEEVTPDQIASYVQNLIKPNDSKTKGSGRIDKAAAAMITLIEANQNLTGNTDEILGFLDAFESLTPNGLKPLKATATKEKTDKRVGWAKSIRRTLKMLWTRNPGFFRKGDRKVSTRLTEANKVSNSNAVTELLVSPELKNMSIRKLNNGNATGSTHIISLNTGFQGNTENENENEENDAKTSPIPKIIGTDQTSDAESKNGITNTEDIIENALDALGQVSDNVFVMSLVQTYLPKLLKRLSENGFLVTDLLATVDLSGNTDPRNMLTMLKEDQKFVDAMAAILSVSPEVFDRMNVLQLVMALRNAL